MKFYTSEDPYQYSAKLQYSISIPNSGIGDPPLGSTKIRIIEK
jgi:hypothetical protein